MKKMASLPPLNPHTYRYRWTLMVGIMVNIIAIAAIAIYELLVRPPHALVERDTITFFGIVSTCLIYPTIEEFTFRFWTRGTRFAYLTSYILTMATTAAITKSIAATIIVATLLPIVFHFFRNKSWFVPGLIVIAALYFSILHIYIRKDAPSLTLILSLLSTAGGGLWFGYLALNKGIHWAIITHMAWNTSMLALLLAPTLTGSIDDTTETFSIQMKPQITNKQYAYSHGDTLFFLNSPAAVARELSFRHSATQGNDTLHGGSRYRHSNTAYGCYRFIIVPTSPQFAYGDVVEWLKKHQKITVETTTIKPLRLTELESKHPEGNVTIVGLINYIQLKYGVPVVLNSTLPPNLMISTQFYTNKHNSLKDFRHYLERNYGFTLDSTAPEIQITTYRSI